MRLVLMIAFLPRPETRREPGSGDGAPSSKSWRSRLCPATTLAVCRVIAFLSTAVITLPARGEEPTRTQQDLFTSRVRPILARHCFKCHGPDDKARKAKLRLDLRAQAIKAAASGAIPIVPGKPDESELVSRIFAEDANERMPPPATKNPLSDADKEVIKRWIADGAEYKNHWAFIAPRNGPPPQVQHAKLAAQRHR